MTAGREVVFSLAWHFLHNLLLWLSTRWSGDEWGKLIKTSSTTGRKQGSAQAYAKALVKILCTHEDLRQKEGMALSKSIDRAQKVSKVQMRGNAHIDTILPHYHHPSLGALAILQQQHSNTKALKTDTHCPSTAAGLMENIMEAVAAVYWISTVPPEKRLKDTSEIQVSLLDKIVPV